MCGDSRLQRALLCACLLLVGFFQPSFASSFKVNPIKFNFDKNTKSSVLKLTNTSDKAVTVQLEAKRWTQGPGGEDVFSNTENIIFFPKIVQIKVGEKRIVRIGYRGKLPEDQEHFYRLFAQELPSQAARNGALNFAFRFSMPIFIKPEASRLREKPYISQVRLDKGKVLVNVVNNGNGHTIVKKISATGYANGSKPVFSTVGNGWYVLPGASRQFQISLNESSCQQADKISLQLSTGDKQLTASMPVTNVLGCTPQNTDDAQRMAGASP